uniref:C2H2-type domain-containing protein n=1 Tax=Trichobilharzia regenti TaxID=157069 RepID=A0AA85ITB8_TRIRE|nr:unnamed protein product [Trichobilharzia regenti]
MSLDDIIVDHESNQCLFVCAKCGAEYVTRDMLAMHMMDSARAGMCIETDTVSSIQNINNNNNNNSNHKMSTNEESVISEQSSTAPKLNQSSNMFEYSQPPYASLPNWIGERTEPIFNMLFNQLTLPHIYSLQNATLNANTNNNNNNNMHSANLMSLNHKIFSALEESLPSSFRGFRNASSSSTASSSITDVQKDEDGIQSLLMNSKYQTNNNLGQNVKMNFIHSLKVNKNDMFTSLATKDKIRMSSGKSNSNLSEYYKGRLKQISSEVNHSQRCTSPANPWIKSFGNQGSSNSSSSSSSSITSTGAISKPFNSPADTNIKSNNGNTKCTATLQSKSQTIVDRSANDQEGFKITYTNTQMKVCDVARSSRSTKCKDAKNLKAIKRSRSLPSPRTLLSQQMCSESTPSRVNENSVVEKTNDISPCDEMLHKVRFKYLVI